MDNNRAGYRMANRSKFMQAIVLGAFTGAAISLFDRQTRNAVMSSSNRCMSGMKSLLMNPNNALNQVKQATGRLRSTIENISADVAFISSRVEEMKDIPPQVAQVVKETKDAFVSEEAIKHTGQSANLNLQH
ncbi:YtxH domain-containing protein [Peribacillus cavernae]|uniref:YtxH domain-containing protein n=1 Tax=Peribacillus cavernae TaxID=1674310 RepID=A0A433HB09_9BACI|nr:YtxH domain-containing protein [Peribacillus cavernae]MDQ0220391.1 hypothetical protein [Peribacillus cavernae]RUQ25522.1 YtxH domain-containing protein [Peribacillus cavernae]